MPLRGCSDMACKGLGKGTIDELCETGWLEARPAQSGRMIEIVNVIDKQWDDIGEHWEA